MKERVSGCISSFFTKVSHTALREQTLEQDEGSDSEVACGTGTVANENGDDNAIEAVLGGIKDNAVDDNAECNEASAIDDHAYEPVPCVVSEDAEEVAITWICCAQNIHDVQHGFFTIA